MLFRSLKPNNNDKNDNKETIRKIVSLRLEKARLLGFNNYANFVLDETMAKNDSNVMSLLNNLWSYALPKAKAEAAELQQLMDKEGKGEKLEAWDWWYYTEKLRKEKYNLSEEDTKPYFKLENVREGAFAVANKLYGITLSKLEGAPPHNTTTPDSEPDQNAATRDNASRNKKKELSIPPFQPVPKAMLPDRQSVQKD